MRTEKSWFWSLWTRWNITARCIRHFSPQRRRGKNEDDPDNGLVILKVIHEDGEDLLSTLDSDEELEAVYEQFMELLFDDEEE